MRIVKKLLQGKFMINVFMSRYSVANIFGIPNRRTTLTRHQNHHTETISEAAAATAAALATRRSLNKSNLQPLQLAGSSTPHEENLESVSHSYTSSNSSLNMSQEATTRTDLDKLASITWRTENQSYQTITPRLTPRTT